MDLKPLHRKQPAIFTCVVLFLLLACDVTFSVGYPTPTFAPPPETPTATPPVLNLEFTSIPYNENNLNPPATITAQIPQLLGSNDKRVASFNQALNDLVNSEINSFKAGLSGLPDPPKFAISTFDAKYNILYQDGDLWSIKFDLAVYVDGAAHPGDLNHTFNYDFAHSQLLNLSDLFLAGSNYLEAISIYCSDQLASRQIGFDFTTVGAEPISKNYRNWNITSDGLMLTFERGQIAAYAVPAQIVIIPYRELKDIINPQGPLGGMLK